MEQRGQYFSANYAEARDRFRAAVERSGGRLDQLCHPSEVARDGTPLSVDVGLLGPDDAPSVALIVSGTHGQEGFAGSAAQLCLLHDLETRSLPQGVRLVLIHAMNPWGWANFSRTTEGNVDLNRNFLKFDGDALTSPLYAELNEILSPVEMSSEALDIAWARIGAFMTTHGAKAVSDAMAGGQYLFPLGMNYGGMQPVWSNRTLHAILERHVSRAERVALLDWHTGMGGFGETFFCCFHDREGEAFARAAQWWGREAVLGGDVGAGLPAPDYKGLLFNGVVEALGNTPVTGSVIEFGTYPLPDMAKALMVDQWLKFGAGQDSERDAWHNWMLERFCPASPDWREAVIEKANDTQRRMIEGLAAWR